MLHQGEHDHFIWALSCSMETKSQPWFFLTTFLILLASKTHFTLAADYISLKQPLSGNQTIISKGGNFELGFFTPGQSRSYYIGIWYKKISICTVVWVANRETPLPNKSSELRISGDGNLLLVNSTKIPTWSSNATSAASKRTIAILLDSGNLVLRDRSSSSSVFWQSFDFPTDTWLPEQKLGLNKATGLSPRLISWRNSEDPAPGLYSLHIEADSTIQFSLMYNNSIRRGNSGLWNGQKFPADPELPKEITYQKLSYTNRRYVSNGRENYYIYSVTPGYIIRFVLGTSGQMNYWIWVNQTQNWNVFYSIPFNQCDGYGVCGSFGVCSSNTDTLAVCSCLQGFRPLYTENWEMRDWTGGCVREADVICAQNNSVNEKRVAFQRIPSMQLPVNPKSVIAEGAEKCEAACLDDCSCTAYSYNSGGCFIWNGDLLNLRQLSDGDINGRDLYVRLSADSKKAKKGGLALVIACTSVGLLASLAVVSVLIWRWRRKLRVHASSLSADSLFLFSYRDLRRATNDFAEKLGGGSFGSVFKGLFPDSSVVAVKKLEGQGQGEKQFRSEVSTIGRIQHVNLVRLRGFCSEGSKRLLVYDFMPNGSLNSHLFGQHTNVLGWKTRYQIALGIAKGLAYLHEECRECILHCDIKPENILLDSAFCPKVSDFGMAKLLGREFSRVLTTMRGTWGYLAPEWIQGVPITAKADVYSYGMMVLEIISGCRNSQQHEISGVDYFPVWAASRIEEDDLLSLLDPRLKVDADIEELKRASRVACWCIQEDEASRPSMGQVVLILEGSLEVTVPPIPRFLQNLTSMDGGSSWQ